MRIKSSWTVKQNGVCYRRNEIAAAGLAACGGSYGKDKEEKARYKKLKRLYNLSDMRTEEEKEADFAEELW